MSRQSPVYPRWRGEHARLKRIDSDILGLSPLARGTQELGCEGWFIVRFIPAGAGNTLL